MIRTLCIISVMLLSAATCAEADSVVGSGTAGYSSFNIAAYSGPDGENPTGTLEIVTGIGTFEGTVTGLCVNDNLAMIIGSLALNPYGRGFVEYVQDNAGTDKPDLMRLQILGYVPLECPPFQMISPAAVTTGDIAVVDDPALPTFSSLSALATQYVLASGAPGAGGLANSLSAKLSAAERAAGRDDANAKAGELQAFVNEVSALEAAGVLTADQAATLSSQAMLL